MDVRMLGGLALVGGSAALGAGVSHAALSTAGDSEGDGLMPLVGMLGGSSLLAGGLSGIVAMQASRLGSGTWAPGIAKFLAVPAGIAGAVVGGRIARAGLEDRHRPEYDRAKQVIDESMTATQDVLRGAGASEDVLTRVRESYDRSYFNASYQPPRGPFGDQIVIGRAPGGGPLAIDDVIAHEFSHKVLHAYSPQLLSREGDGQAIHETIADTFAMAVDDDDWLVGEDAIPGGMRSFSHPELHGAGPATDPEPAPITRDQLSSTTEEHLGAGVGNKAAWRIGAALGRESMARIYVAALERRELPEGATYADLARIVRAAAVDLHGAGSREARAVDDAWRRAGY